MKKCESDVELIHDVLQIIGGKWKLPILTSLYYGTKRFKELERSVNGISAKMLIKELKDLESHGIVKRETFNTVPITVEYSLTPEGLTLKPVLDEMKQWSLRFRESTKEKS